MRDKEARELLKLLFDAIEESDSYGEFRLKAKEALELSGLGLIKLEEVSKRKSE